MNAPSSIGKAEVFAALRDGRIDEDEARSLHGLTAEELAFWQRTLSSMKVPGARGRPGRL